jgi:hypothetical protein
MRTAPHYRAAVDKAVILLLIDVISHMHRQRRSIVAKRGSRGKRRMSVHSRAAGVED